MKKNFLNKKDLVKNVAKELKIEADFSEKVIDKLIEELSAGLICGDRVELRGFGSMQVKKRKPKTILNPKTREKISVPVKGSLYFRASKELLKLMNK